MVSGEGRAQLEDALMNLKHAMDADVFDAVTFQSALRVAEHETDVKLGKFRKGEAQAFVESMLTAVAVAIAIRFLVIQAFRIPSGSMVPTLLVGDHIFVNKLDYGPKIPGTDTRLWTSMPPRRGDVIVFAVPDLPDHPDYIKRVVGLPGDTLEMRNGRLFVNDVAVPRCHVGHAVYSEVTDGSREGELYVENLDGRQHLSFYSSGGGRDGIWHVKPGEVFVFGDNRDNSRDSRLWFKGEGGGVPFANIQGRALLIWWSNNLSRQGLFVHGKPHLPDSMKQLQPQLDLCLSPNAPMEPVRR
jgi:signal peptidase I